MKNYYGYEKLAEFVGMVTMKEFCKVYNAITASPDKEPLASTIIPVLDEHGATRFDDKEGCNPLYECVIFYKQKSEDTRKLDEQGKVVEQTPPKKEISMEL